MVCKGLLNASEIPPKSGAPAVGAGHRLISGDTPTNASPDCGQGLGAGVTILHGRDPLRALLSGTRSTPVWCRCWSRPSKLPNTKVLFLRIGPPAAAPNWLRWKPGTELGSKKLRASRSLFRMNSYSDPWNPLLPDCVTMRIWPPGCLPYSAP